MRTRSEIARRNAVLIRRRVRGLPRHARLRIYEELVSSWFFPVRFLRQISDAAEDAKAQCAVEGRPQPPLKPVFGA